MPKAQDIRKFGGKVVWNTYARELTWLKELNAGISKNVNRQRYSLYAVMTGCFGYLLMRARERFGLVVYFIISILFDGTAGGKATYK